MKSNKINYSTNGVIALVVLAVVYGISTVVARYLSGGLGVFEQWYLRYAIGCVVGAAIFYRQISFRKFLTLPGRGWAVLLFRVVIGQIIAIGLYTVAVQRTKIGLVSFMEVLPMSALLGAVIFRERLPWRRPLLMTCSFLGAAVVVVGNLHDLLAVNFGAVLVLIGLVFYAFMLVTRRWHTGVLNNQEISVALAAVSAVLTYLLSLVLYRRWIIPAAHWSGKFTLILVAAGCLSIAMNFLSNYGYEHVSAVVAGNILSLQEVFGPVFGFIFYREVLGVRDIAGGLIILLSVILTNHIARREYQGQETRPAPQ